MAGRPPYFRHLANQNRESRQWNAIDLQITDDDIQRCAELTGATLEHYIHQRFLTRQEVSTVLKMYRKQRKKGERTEYYDFLEKMRDQYCVPAMRDCVSGTCASMRAAVMARLQSEGLLLVSQ